MRDPPIYVSLSFERAMGFYSESCRTPVLQESKALEWKKDRFVDDVGYMGQVLALVGGSYGSSEV